MVLCRENALSKKFYFNELKKLPKTLFTGYAAAFSVSWLKDKTWLHTMRRRIIRRAAIC